METSFVNRRGGRANQTPASGRFSAFSLSTQRKFVSIRKKKDLGYVGPSINLRTGPLHGEGVSGQFTSEAKRSETGSERKQGFRETMPCLNLSTNVSLEGVDTSAILSEASSAVAKIIGKPEAYVMIVLKGSVPIAFGGTEQPAAYGELVSIGGLTSDVNKKLSAAIANVLENKLSIPKSRFLPQILRYQGFQLWVEWIDLLGFECLEELVDVLCCLSTTAFIMKWVTLHNLMLLLKFNAVIRMSLLKLPDISRVDKYSLSAPIEDTDLGA
ncbi:macrophage migration inhibitory factor homolog [Phtheirospermum japonicum]|uniref:Macrophage migration inhibitory factor homolog n=1 Tax=Phtheirospermum japonicum TaxID=374723 RepID=A0A830C8S0_9LAMI|nr:macrophage migration inhibitory factor homolog [Phtheirospermum japonicum]